MSETQGLQLALEFDPIKAQASRAARTEEARRRSAETHARRARKVNRVGIALAKRAVGLANDGHLDEEMITRTRPVFGHGGYINRHPEVYDVANGHLAIQGLGIVVAAELETVVWEGPEWTRDIMVIKTIEIHLADAARNLQ